MPEGVFERIVCGVDGSPASLEAVRQSDVLLEERGKLLLVAVVEPMQAIHFQVSPTFVHAARHAAEKLEKLDEAAAEALERARAEATRGAEVATLETGGHRFRACWTRSRRSGRRSRWSGRTAWDAQQGFFSAALRHGCSTGRRAPFSWRDGPPPGSGLRERSSSASTDRRQQRTRFAPAASSSRASARNSEC
jgi:hypothetical protein